MCITYGIFKMIVIIFTVLLFFFFIKTQILDFLLNNDKKKRTKMLFCVSNIFRIKSTQTLIQVFYLKNIDTDIRRVLEYCLKVYCLCFDLNKFSFFR